MNVRMAFRFALWGLLLMAPIIAHADEWTFGPYSIHWRDGYRRIPQSDSGAHFVNEREGTKVTVTVLTHAASKDVENAIRELKTYAATELPNIASRNGRISVPLTNTRTTSDNALYLIGSDKRVEGLPVFGIVFLDISPRGNAAQITVEGLGTAKGHLARFEKLFDSAKWTER